MGLLDTISKMLGRNAAFRNLEENPFRTLCAASISQRLDDAHLRDEFSPEAIERLSAWLWQECLGIEAHEHPRARCRYLLVDQTLMRSKFEVLIMKSEPHEDVTGLVGTQGITGKLNAHIDEIFRVDEELRDMTGLALPDVSWQTANDAAVLMTRKAYWISAVFNDARVGLNDKAADKERDWYKPFIHSAFVGAEFFTRRKMGMPSAIEHDENGMIALAYNSFMEFVLDDQPYPLKGWRNQYRCWIDDGRICPPFGGD